MKTKQISAVDTKTVRRLLAAGCPLPDDNSGDDIPEPDLTFEVTQPDLTRAYDRRGGAEYVFAVRITNHSYNRIQIQSFNARVPWRRRLYWPGVPSGSNPQAHIYRLESGRKFAATKVLNHYTGERGNLEPGASFKGLLLAYSMYPSIPQHFFHGSLEHVRLSAVDQYGRWHASYVEMLVDRTATMRAPSVRRPGEGLFEKPEIVTNPFSTYVPSSLDVCGNARLADTERCRATREEAAPADSIFVPSNIPAPANLGGETEALDRIGGGRAGQ